MLFKERELPVATGDLPTPAYENAGFSGPYDVQGSYEAWCWMNPAAIWENPRNPSESRTCKATPIEESYNLGRENASTITSVTSDSGYEKLRSSTRGKPLFNACEHEIAQGFNYPFLSSVTKASNSSNFRYRRFSKPTGAGYTSCPVLKRVPFSAFEDTRRRAWWSMQPRFETEVKLLNFIYELKDFKRMAKMMLNFKIADIGLKLRSLRKKLQSVGDRELSVAARGWQTLADITKTAAGARLVNEFAIKPTISDLTAIFTTLASTIDLAQSQFKGRGSLKQLSHYTESGPEIKIGSYGTVYYTPRFLGTLESSIFTATMEYRYKYDMRTGWEKWKAGMGLEFNAEAVWNGLPFSFIVDYVYQVGNALHYMNTDPNVSLRLLQYCESILQINSVGYHMDTSCSTLRCFYAPSNPMGGAGMVPVNGYAKSLYRRRLVSPNKGAALPRAKSPSEGQTWNLAALVRCFFD